MNPSFDELMHYGTKRHSGRYPWGSGENPYQHEGGIRGAYKALIAAGFTEKEIADEWGMSINELRDRKAIEKVESRNAKREKVIALSAAGKTNTEIAKELGINESSDI